MNILSRRELNTIAVQQFKHEDQTLALLRIRGDLRQRILEQFDRSFALEGDQVKEGGAVSSAAILSLVAGGGLAGATSTYFANSLFIATANPATLMSIGGGVGSAVIGAAGIVGQAPFVAAGSAAAPVVLPLLAFQVMNTVTVLTALRPIFTKLDELKRSLNRSILRGEATHVGGMISADCRLTELEEDFALCNRFSSSMVIRLAILEGEVNPQFERYSFLRETAGEFEKNNDEDLAFRQFDASNVIEASLLDLRIDILRLRLAAQEEIGTAAKARDRLIGKIERYSQIWESIASEPKGVESVAQELGTVAKDMGWWSRKMPNILFGDRAEYRRRCEQEVRLERHSRRVAIDVAPKAAEAVSAAEQLVRGLNDLPGKPVSLVYWRDETGEHSFYTSDLEIQSKPAPEVRGWRRYFGLTG